MKGKEKLEKLMIDLLRINPSETNLNFYNQIAENLEDFDIVDHFHQIRKDNEDGGLAFEVMLFNKDVIHDIVITKTNVNYISVTIDKVNMAYLETKYSEETNENGIVSIVDKLKFTISYGGEFKLVYEASIKKFEELLRIKSNLLKTALQS